jgi:carboxylesterase
MANQAIQNTLGQYGFYEQRGEDAVLLVHGLTGTPAEMRYIARNLTKKNFSVACPQLAGHCDTVDTLKQSKWQDWYKSIENTFEALKQSHKRVYVSGLSMGALIALKLAENKGQAVNGIGLLSVTFFYDGWNISKFKRQFLLPIVLNSPLQHFLSWKEPSPYGIKCERTRALVQAVLENREATASEKVGIFTTPAITIKESTRLIKAAREGLANVVSPTLIVHALEDDMASIKNAYFVADRISSKKVDTFFVDDTYHVLTLDKRKDDISLRMADFFHECTQQNN